MEGILCINKPKDFTSFDVVAKLRGILREKKIGHAGTLDPMATGVLPVFVGKATKAISLMENHDKSYRAEFLLGITTDTLDITGEVLCEKKSNVTYSELSSVLDEFVGKINQVPPMYSAVKINGRPLYKLAREGKTIERQEREVTIYDINLVQFDEKKQKGIIDVSCSSGTYIRTLCDDAGKKLETGAVLTNLTRTAACGYSLDKCYTFEELESLKEKGELEKTLLKVESLFEKTHKIQLCEQQERMFCNGVKLDLSLIENIDYDKKMAVYGSKFLGIAHADGDILRIDKLFV